MFTYFKKENYLRTRVAYLRACCTCALFRSVDKYVSRQRCKYSQCEKLEGNNEGNIHKHFFLQ